MHVTLATTLVLTQASSEEVHANKATIMGPALPTRERRMNGQALLREWIYCAGCGGGTWEASLGWPV